MSYVLWGLGVLASGGIAAVFGAWAFEVAATPSEGYPMGRSGRVGHFVLGVFIAAVAGLACLHQLLGGPW